MAGSSSCRPTSRASLRWARVTTISADISNRETGKNPPDGSLATFSTTLGLFDDPAAGSSVVTGSIVNGVVKRELFGGVDAGTANVAVSFQNATGRINVNVTPGVFLFLEAIEPNHGSESGGYNVTVFGQGIGQFVRVSVDGTFAEVVSSGSNAVTFVMPPSGADIPEEQERAVDVTVENCEAAVGESGDTAGSNCVSDTLIGAFRYIGDPEPDDNGD